MHFTLHPSITTHSRVTQIHHHDHTVNPDEHLLIVSNLKQGLVLGFLVHPTPYDELITMGVRGQPLDPIPLVSSPLPINNWSYSNTPPSKFRNATSSECALFNSNPSRIINSKMASTAFLPARRLQSRCAWRSPYERGRTVVEPMIVSCQ